MATTQNVTTGSMFGSLAKLFVDRKINTKIAFGFGCVLLITAVISFMAYSAFGQVSAAFGTYAQRVMAVGIARSIDRDFLAFRRFVREFALTGDEANIAPAEKERATLKEGIAKGLATFKNPERRAKMEDIARQFESYSKDFDKVVALKRDQTKLVKDVLDPSGVKMRTDLLEQQTVAAKNGVSNTAILAGEAVNQVMLVRLNANKLLARHEQSSADAAGKAFADLQTVMAAIDGAIRNEEGRKLFDEIKVLAQKYHEGYLHAADLNHEIDNLVNVEMKKKWRRDCRRRRRHQDQRRRRRNRARARNHHSHRDDHVVHPLAGGDRARRRCRTRLADRPRHLKAGHRHERRHERHCRR
jgi:CHASE3 domain sensor protein